MNEAMTIENIIIPLKSAKSKILDTSINKLGELVIKIEVPKNDPHTKPEYPPSQDIQIQSLRQLPPNPNLEVFTRALTHDLRNPLSIIIGCADMLSKDRAQLPATTTNAMIDEILSASNQLNSILVEVNRMAQSNIKRASE